ncbi:MAG: hypothetical protein L6R38_008344 [Xanthoria sp. 2 TBL-2021]|nr:MAG: hypothetical protein L6R38_008344 [Xanthoria sp. 2 TBL-2021]
MSSHPPDTDDYHHYLVLSNLAIRSVVIWMAKELPDQEYHPRREHKKQRNPSGNKYAMSVLKRAAETNQTHLPSLYWISEKLKLAIRFRKEAAELYEKDPNRYNDNNSNGKRRKKKTISFKKTRKPHRPGKKNRGGPGNKIKKIAQSKGKKHQGQIRTMEESLRVFLKIINQESTTSDETVENNEPVEDDVPVEHEEQAENDEETEVESSGSDSNDDESGSESDASDDSS